MPPSHPRKRSSRGFETLEARSLLAANPIINEFVADNAAGLADEDGQNSDWVEILNAGDQPVNLAGWHLTDDAAALGKWTFPARTLQPGDFLVVFASDKNRAGTGPLGQLHANFKLDSGGEYLALVRPDFSIASQFAPAYPRQLEDVAFGTSMTPTTFVGENHPLEYLVPTSDALEPAWRQPGFANPGLVTGTPANASTLVVTEAATGAVDAVEIQNVSNAAVNTAGWKVVVNQADNLAVPAYSSLVSTDPGVVSYWRLSENLGAQGGLAHGQAVVNRDGPDGFHGVAVYDTPFPDGGIGATGRVTTWRFHNDTPGTAGRQITPLLLEDTGVDQYQVRGIGTTRLVTEAGLQTWDFAVAQGTDVFDWTLGRFHMGLRYGSPTVSNPGVVEFSAGANGWDFFGSATGAPNVVLNTQITGGSTFDNLGRDYSAQFTVVPTTGGTAITADDAVGANDGQYATSGLAGLRLGAIVGDTNLAVDFAGGETTVPHHASLSFGGTALTVEAWVQVDTLGATRWIVAKDDSDAATTPGLDYALGITPAGEFRFASQGLAQQVTASAPIVASSTAWHHVVGVQDPATSTLRLFVDGQLRGTSPLVTLGVTSAGPLKIGDRNAPGGQNVDGRIDEVALYRRALSTSDIVAHYLSGIDSRAGGVNRALPIVWELPSSVAAGQTLFRNDQPGGNFFGADIPWSNGGAGWAMILNAAQQPVDFAAWGYSAAQLQGLSIDVAGQAVSVGAHWAGSGAASLGTDATSLARQGTQDRNQASDFVWRLSSFNTTNPGLTTPFAAESLPLRGGVGYARADAGAGQGETVGPSVIDRAVTDGASGSIFQLDNHPFTQVGRITQWSMFSTTPLRLTPLILRAAGGGYEIVGIGETRVSTAAGLQSYAFNLQAGSDLVQPGDFFGFKDGDDAIDNTGVIDWDDGTGDRVRWFGGGRAGTTTVGSNLGTGQTFPRSYSLRATTSIPLANEIDVNVESALYNQRTSLYVRYPFNVAQTGGLDTLTLRARYDDGFVAYLNGVEIARRNVPAATTFASTATSDRSISQATTYEEINVTAFRHLLVAGPNVLAIHGFNDAASSSDFLVEAQLLGAGFGTTATYGYLTTPTPGAVNGLGQTGYVGDTLFDHDRGFYTAPFTVAITTPQTPDADIYYTTDESVPSPTNPAATRYVGPIAVSQTTVLRAAGFKANFLPSNVDTLTYIFVADVMQQSLIAPAIRNDPVWGPQLDDSLLEIPSISVVIPGQTGVPLAETPISIELLNPDGTPGFQADAGVERSGSTSLGYQKNSMRVSFKRLYGPANLQFNPFGEGAAPSYDQLLLRSSHDSINYTHGNGTRGVYLRNRWINDRQREMGSPAPRSRPVHVYLNGEYWGVYDLMERPDGAFMASYFGGGKDDYDALNSGAASNGDLVAFNATVAAAGNLATLQETLDLENYADYMLTQFYGGNDWDWNHFQNWSAARKREPGAKWAWFHWDSDMILRTTPTANVVDRGGPGNMWGAIKQHPAFRQVLADRAQRLFFNDGILTPNRVLASLNTLADEFDLPIVAESARWGGGGYTPATWRQQFDQMVAQWVATRTQTVIDQLRAAGVFPTLDAPRFAVNNVPQHGGMIVSGALLSLTATGTTTTNTVDLVRTTDPVAAFVPADDALGDEWQSHSYVQGAHGETWLAGTNGVGYDTVTATGPNYLPVIGLNVQAQMSGAGRNTSAYVRLPFTIANQAALDSFTALKLRLLYDDGYVAYINGTEVAFGNAPGRGGFTGVLDWNSRSPTSLDANLAAPTLVDLTSRRNLLRVGTNVLAIHVLNGNNTSSDLLIRPELFAEAAGLPPVPPTILYTLDGSDPQAPGAVTYTTPVPLTAATLVKARALEQGQWSALSEALFTISIPPLRVTELMFNPRSAGPGETFPDKDQYEFVEVQNISGTETLDLTGYQLIDGVAFTFPALSLAPGQRAVVVGNVAAFQERYGTSLPIAGAYVGNFSNAGEHVALVGPLGEPVHDFTYDDAWHPSTDGGGHSLVVLDPHAALATWNTAAAWRPSHEIDGSPRDKDLMLGDLNEDDRVNLVDLAILQMNFGRPAGATRSQGDLDRNGAINRDDATLLARNFGRQFPTPAPSPSPAPTEPSATPKAPARLSATRQRRATSPRT